MTEKEVNSMMNMQEEAKRRVMDMASRSRFAAEDMNRRLFENPDGREQRAASHETKSKESVSKAAFAGMNAEELEKMFILSLCLLLSYEGADESVILGLMYLLS